MNTSGQAGFTLVELLTCMVIAGILAAAVGPRFFDNQTLVTRGFVDEVASSLRYAQRIAIASECSVRVTINAAGYRARQRSAHATCNTAGAWDQAVVRSDGTQLRGSTPSDVAGMPNAVVIFDRSGNVAGGANIAIPIGLYVINIDRPSGRVSVQ